MPLSLHALQVAMPIVMSEFLVPADLEAALLRARLLQDELRVKQVELAEARLTLRHCRMDLVTAEYLLDDRQHKCAQHASTVRDIQHELGILANSNYANVDELRNEIVKLSVAIAAEVVGM